MWENESGRDRKLMEGEAADTLSAADEGQSSSARMYGFSSGVCRLSSDLHWRLPLEFHSNLFVFMHTAAVWLFRK